MATTIADISVLSDAWLDVNTASGVLAGSAISILNKGNKSIYIYEGAAPPAVTSTDGVILTNTSDPYGRGDVEAGSLTIWARCAVPGSGSRINVQAV